ncbi:hypothetical protein TBC1_11399 [Lentimicrobium saccharophilum]|uniref:Uncharacterized protein n=1 Tax=Lentimicrobium saccharophilum TaxID=1678841 RepID=A0A0S7BX04_9BACT|nr:hypothetical protein TBC1_11399 [Lentimicrobium saccharophilum]
MNGSSTSATPSFRCHSFSIETKKMNTFEFRRRTHYTQKGILPKFFKTIGRIPGVIKQFQSFVHSVIRGTCCRPA